MLRYDKQRQVNGSHFSADTGSTWFNLLLCSRYWTSQGLSLFQQAGNNIQEFVLGGIFKRISSHKNTQKNQSSSLFLELHSKSSFSPSPKHNGKRKARRIELQPWWKSYITDLDLLTLTTDWISTEGVVHACFDKARNMSSYSVPRVCGDSNVQQACISCTGDTLLSENKAAASDSASWCVC